MNPFDGHLNGDESKILTSRGTPTEDIEDEDGGCMAGERAKMVLLV